MRSYNAFQLMSTLLVLLPRETPAAGGEFAFALSDDRRTVRSHGAAPAARLPQPRGTSAEIVAVVPPEALSWHRLELPKGVARGSPRLRNVLEGLLEERLLDEPDALHFALGPEAAGSTVWVAACDRAWLRRCLQTLEAAGRAANRVVPEFAPQNLPLLCALGPANQPVLVWADAQGVLCLPLAAGCVALLPTAAREAACHAEPAAAGVAEQVFGRSVQLEQPHQRWLRAAQSAWNLAQFEFANSGQARIAKKLASGWTEFVRAPHWRPARWGAALFIALNVLGLNAWAWKEKAALQAKREAIRSTLTQTFPHVRAVVDAPAQMEREVAALRQQAGIASGRDLESMLAALAMAAPPGRTVTGLEYNGNDLRVRGLRLSAEELRPVAANLRSLGYASTLQSDVLVIAQESAP